MNETTTMTVQEMLPNFGKLLNSKAVKRIIVYVDADMDSIPHLTDDTDDETHLSAAYSFEALTPDKDHLQRLTEVFDSVLPCKVQTLLKSPLNNGVLAVFVTNPEGNELQDTVAEYLSLRPGDIYKLVQRTCALAMSIGEPKFDDQYAVVKFFIDDSDEARVEARIADFSSSISDAEQTAFIDKVTTAIPEFSDGKHTVTHIGMECVGTNEYHVRYAFNHAKGKNLSTDEELLEDTDFGVNFVAEDSDGSEFAPDSKFFINPSDWEILMPETEA